MVSNVKFTQLVITSLKQGKLPIQNINTRQSFQQFVVYNLMKQNKFQRSSWDPNVERCPSISQKHGKDERKHRNITLVVT